MCIRDRYMGNKSNLSREEARGGGLTLLEDLQRENKLLEEELSMLISSKETRSKQRSTQRGLGTCLDEITNQPALFTRDSKQREPETISNLGSKSKEDYIKEIVSLKTRIVELEEALATKDIEMEKMKNSRKVLFECMEDFVRKSAKLGDAFCSIEGTIRQIVP
eukprot:TRINITY_DN1688_c0_g4_i1.p1 TRINITY_DN1688_c0_g4~~TRINITY_DN1688_c0_g4_i1.p1  ORF type:complete len:164 (+),score=38.23 TRINITY_DN1688_c0_g4_i1:101-592(+)